MRAAHAGLLALLALTAAAPDETPIAPPAAELDISLSALGLLPLEGHFTRFSGGLRHASTACEVSLTAEVASLAMSSQAVREDMLSPDLLDAGQFPRFSYHGQCHDDVISGVLTLHGVSRPLDLSLRRDAGGWDVTGSFRRDAWGVSGRPLLASMVVHLHLHMQIPNNAQHE